MRPRERDPVTSARIAAETDREVLGRWLVAAVTVVRASDLTG